MVHQDLKSGRGISERKGHNSKFIETLMCSKGCFWNIGRVHSNLVIPLALRSSLVKMVAPVSSSSRSLIIGIGNLFLIVMALSWR